MLPWLPSLARSPFLTFSLSAAEIRKEGRKGIKRLLHYFWGAGCEPVPVEWPNDTFHPENGEPISQVVVVTSDVFLLQNKTYSLHTIHHTTPGMGSKIPEWIASYPGRCPPHESVVHFRCWFFLSNLQWRFCLPVSLKERPKSPHFLQL